MTDIDLTRYEGHTPGPWRCVGTDGAVVFGGSRLVAIPTVDDMPTYANASLIADAPLLLAEVRRLDLEHKAAERELLWVRQSHARLLAAAKRTLTKRQSGAHYNECLAGQRGYGQCSTVCEVLKAAVAKAEGL